MTEPDDLFPRPYVEELRKRSDGYRRRAKTIADAAIQFAIAAELTARGASPSRTAEVSTARISIDANGLVVGVEAAVAAFLDQAQ